jgi:hypothetical protein
MSIERPLRKRRLTNRTIHRWLGIGAGILFLSVAVTGVVLQIQQLFGEEETQKEELARFTSPVDLRSRITVDASALARAQAAVLAQLGDRRVDSIDWQIKGPAQLFVFHLGGDSPIKAEVGVRSGRIVKVESDEEDWLLRLHTGEIVGDGGKVLGLFWGTALVAMLITGSLVYLQLYRARQRGTKARRGWRRFFWMLIPAVLLTAAPRDAHAAISAKVPSKPATLECADGQTAASADDEYKLDGGSAQASLTRRPRRPLPPSTNFEGARSR